MVEAARETFLQLKGAQAVVTFSRNEPDKIITCRIGNAGGVAIGVGEDEMFLASDIPAILEHTRDMIFLESREMAINPRVALTFYWHALHRQVRIEGEVEKVSIQESEEYFQTRPRGSQIGAWASPQSEEIANREMLELRVAEIEERFKDRPINCPPFWGGFRVKPERIEFWQGRESRLHDRLQYRKQDDGNWIRERLAP